MGDIEKNESTYADSSIGEGMDITIQVAIMMLMLMLKIKEGTCASKQFSFSQFSQFSQFAQIAQISFLIVQGANGHLRRGEKDR